jgi:hypothetical protein
METIITFLLLLTPFGVVWYLTYRYLRKYIQTILNYSVLILCSVVGLCSYCLIILLFADQILNDSLGDKFAVISYFIFLGSSVFAVPLFFLISILTLVHFIKGNKKNN